MNFGNLLTILPLGILALDDCTVTNAIIAAVAIIIVAIINKLPMGKDKPNK